MSVLILASGMHLEAGQISSSSPKAGEVPELFVTADQCMACHNGISTPTGGQLSFGIDWRSSMMANAARDPYWHAAVRRETLDHPSAAAAIENECSACHMPMTRFRAKAGGGLGGVFKHLPIGDSRAQAATPDNLLAADGVSCALCHQIRDERFGEREGFTAGFVVDSERPLGEREIFGPFPVDSGRQRIMQSAARFSPTEGTQIQESELCATCHTLFTHSLGPDGEVIGELPEQVPYLEWEHSQYHDVQSCQSCHMPVVEGETAITSVLGQPRNAVSRHVFRGGNFFMPRVFDRHRGELGVTALSGELEATAAQSETNLATRSATLTMERMNISGDKLELEVSIRSQTGHKLPTAYPSRRAWLHLTVVDAEQALLFESGKINPDGAIAGNDNDADPEKYEPHHALIETPDQVQIYETILGAPEGRVTTGLLTAVRYLKDNRILPLGFDKATADDDIAVAGVAADDPDFTGGEDRVRYSIAVGKESGPLTVTARLLYQPIGYRWAQNLRQQEGPEIDRFVSYYEEFSAESWALLAEATAVAK